MKRILVADDSVTIQKVIALTFADEPFEVQSVGTGSEALELVKSWNPDIVLADVIMPQMNGYELCRAVKQQETGSSVPVLLLAGTFEAFDEEEARSVGADGYITKPFESGELIEKVRTLLGDSPPVPEAEAAPAAAAEEASVPAEPGVETAPELQEGGVSPAGAPAEPDIWDILSESGDDAQATSADSGAKAPAFGPIEGTGVVDVGSFDVGIGRPESQPPPPEASMETPEPMEVPEVPPGPEPAQDMDEKSRVENMEKDFFGFETGAVEEVPGTDILEEAVEEVTFEMEQPQVTEEVDAQEVSFVVPEPATDQAIATGETISPDLMAPEPTVEPAPPAVETIPPVPEPAVFPGDEADAVEAVAAQEPESQPAPVEVPVPDSIDIPGFAPETVPEPAPPITEVSDAAPAAVEPMEMELQPEPEPPLELPVDLTQDLPGEFSPDAVPTPVSDEAVSQPDEPSAGMPAEDVPADLVPEPLTEPAPEPGGGIPDDEAIRKMVEEKVEKIAWEVVPEMAEVIIREAIQKIKDGT